MNLELLHGAILDFGLLLLLSFVLSFPIFFGMRIVHRVKKKNPDHRPKYFDCWLGCVAAGF